MQVGLHLAVVLEMLVVNLSTVHLCSHRKGSLAKTLAILLAWTAAVVGGMLIFLQRSPYYGNGNGLFVLVGFVYLIPLCQLYEERLRRMLIIICSSWVYTMMAFALAVHVARLFPPAQFALAALITQTLFYLATVRLFHRFVRGPFVYVLNNTPPTAMSTLQAVCLLWFATAILVNLTFVVDQNGVLKVICLLCLAVNAVLSYQLIYRMVRGMKDIEHLKEIAYTDPLTGLRNRSSMFQETERLLQSQTPFTLIFFDLDQFKSVNDRHGHGVGDAYLAAFARQVQQLLGLRGTLYRISGDEFIAIMTTGRPDLFLEELRRQTWPDMPCPFQGVSTGCAAFPDDAGSLDVLMARADKDMYRAKAGGEKA